MLSTVGVGMDGWDTRREKIVKLLSTGEPVSLDELCRMLGVFDRKIVLEDLSHIAQTLKKKNIKLVMLPPSCLKCGFVFKDLSRPKLPSRCPKCKNERISQPIFQIK
ncbi:MAG: hypothetical protein QXR19_10835 [Candidatus Jordarchaeaceae archaeon]